MLNRGKNARVFYASMNEYLYRTKTIVSRFTDTDHVNVIRFPLVVVVIGRTRDTYLFLFSLRLCVHRHRLQVQVQISQREKYIFQKMISFRFEFFKFTFVIILIHLFDLQINAERQHLFNFTAFLFRLILNH